MSQAQDLIELATVAIARYRAERCLSARHLACSDTVRLPCTPPLPVNPEMDPRFHLHLTELRVSLSIDEAAWLGPSWGVRIEGNLAGSPEMVEQGYAALGAELVVEHDQTGTRLLVAPKHPFAHCSPVEQEAYTMRVLPLIRGALRTVGTRKE